MRGNAILTFVTRRPNANEIVACNANRVIPKAILCIPILLERNSPRLKAAPHPQTIAARVLEKTAVFAGRSRRCRCRVGCSFRQSIQLLVPPKGRNTINIMTISLHRRY